MGTWVTRPNWDVQGVYWILEVARRKTSAVDGIKLYGASERNVNNVSIVSGHCQDVHETAEGP